MIGQLRGTVSKITPTHLVLDVGGVGYLVATHNRMLSRAVLGESMIVQTYLHVTESALDLFGFEHDGELVLFKQLISVSGVGPKSALNIMNLGPVEAIAGAIGRGDLAYLTKVSGVGRKIAERIVVELRSKVGGVGDAVTTSSGDRLGTVIDALVAMGYNQLDARDIVRGLKDVEKTAEELVRDALKMIHERQR